MTHEQKPDWIAIEGEYRAGVASLRDIAERCGVSESYIRKQAKRYGWSRDPASTKRQIVNAAMSGSAQGSAQCALRTIQDAAALNIEDMNRGLRINRLCQINLEAAAETARKPKEIKLIVEANALAVASIRKIRGLDENPAGKEREPLLDDEELDTLLKARGLPIEILEE